MRFTEKRRKTLSINIHVYVYMSLALDIRIHPENTEYLAISLTPCIRMIKFPYAPIYVSLNVQVTIYIYVRVCVN